MKRFNEKGRISIINLLLLLLAVLQGSSQLIGFFVQGNNLSKPSLLNIWISLGDEISENWSTFSVVLILLVVGGLMYSHLFKDESEDARDTNRSRISAIALLVVNLVLCNRIYSRESVSEKMNQITKYTSSHLPTAIVVIIIMLLGVVTIYAIRRARKISSELDESIPTNESISPIEEQEHDGNNKADENRAVSDSEVAFKWKHPFSYALRAYSFYIAEKRKAKQKILKKKTEAKIEIAVAKKDRRLNKIQGKSDSSQSAGIEWLGFFVALASLLFVVIIIVVLFVTRSNEENFLALIVKKVIDVIDEITVALNLASKPLTNILFAIGIPFLLTVLVLSSFILVYLTVQLIISLITNTKDDKKMIRRYAKMIKVFVFGAVDGAMRPLMFIPDFLSLVEDAILETDLDEKIHEVYPECENKDDRSGSDKPQGETPGTSKVGIVQSSPGAEATLDADVGSNNQDLNNEEKK